MRLGTLERVNYYPGQRLLAKDLNQQVIYEGLIRRLLSRGLFSSGVVDGLEVLPAPGSKIAIIVKSGLALDLLGREIYLAADSDPKTRPSEPPAAGRPGYYVVIRYSETTLPGSTADCWPDGTQPQTARYLNQPAIEFTDVYPNPNDCKVKDPLDSGGDFNCGVVLAMVTLNAACEITSIESDLRQLSYPTHSSQVTALAFEGEKDIDASNPKVLRFDVSGGSPNSVQLRIRGALFSKLFYTEMGRHQHPLSLNGAQTHDPVPVMNISHTHHVDDPGGTVNATGLAHRHLLLVTDDSAPPYHGAHVMTNSFDPGAYQDEGGSSPYIGQSARLVQPLGTTSQTPTPQTSLVHHHLLDSVRTHTDDSGANDPNYRGRNDPPLRFLNHLRVILGPPETDITGALLAQLKWTELGDGSSGHAINSEDGTGLIDLTRLAGAPALGLGPHTLRFTVDARVGGGGGGGKVLWNLYIE